MKAKPPNNETNLENFSKKGDKVYDPFLGTGTTAVVAKKMKRKLIRLNEQLNYVYNCAQKKR